MKRDGLAACVALLAAFGLALVLPRESLPCCKAGTCCPTIAHAAAADSCCQTPDECPTLPAHPAKNSDSDRDQGPLGGLGCGSPCCTKAPAPEREPVALLRDESGPNVSMPALQIPLQPDTGGVFHPPRF